MMRRRLIAGLLLVLLPLLGACGSGAQEAGPAATTPSETGLTWTGTEITGAKYFVRRTARAAVHYALPTLPDTAEFVAERAEAYYEKQAKYGRAPLVPHLEVWIVPDSYAWPEGVPAPTLSTLAVAPGVVIFRDILRGNRPGGSGGVYRPLDYFFAAAIYEPERSPIYAQEWLQYGMGMIWTQDWDRFPQEFLVRGAVRQRTASELLSDALAGGPYQMEAWIFFAATIFDRFGINWSAHYKADPAGLTPEAALTWAMGTDNVNAALERLGERRALVNGVPGSRPDTNPERMAPALAKLPDGPGPNPNYSPQSYQIDAELDVSQGTVSGETRLRWQNGEGIPLDALYFNLWANADRYRMDGGYTKVTGVTVDGRPGTFEAMGIDLKVYLGRLVMPGEQVEIAIRFSTHPTANLTSKLGLVAGQRFYLSQFYPTLAVLDDRGWNLHALHSRGGDPYTEHADYQVSLTVPAGFVVGGTGRQVARTENGQTWTYHYEASRMPHWGAVGGLSWVESQVKVGSITVHVLDSDAAWREAVTPAVVETLSFLEGELGPFPLNDLVLVRVGMFSGTLKLPGIASSTDSGGDWYKNVLANSLASQWFGTYVGNDQWTEAWLDEGLSSFMEHRAARAAGRTNTDPARLIDRPKTASVTQNGMDFMVSGEIDLIAGRYAALFFTELEKQIGSEAMTGLLRQWLREYGGKTGTGADLIRLAETTAGPLGPLLAEHAVDPGKRVPYKPVPVPGYDTNCTNTER